MKKILVVFVMLATVSCMAQGEPSVVKSSFAKNFPGVSIKKWEKEDGEYEANFVKDGKKMSATFMANGTLKETETDINISDLPSSITSYIQSNYKGATIKEAAMIVRENKRMYETEVKGKDLLFDTQGQLLKEEKE